MMRGLQSPLGPSGCVAHMGGLICLEIGLAIVPGHGPICLLEFRKLLQASQTTGKCLRHNTGYSVLPGGIIH